MSETASDQNQSVRYGAGIRFSLESELSALGCSRALVLSTPQQSDVALNIAGSLGDKAAGVCSRAKMHTPVDVTEDVMAHTKAVQADCYVAVGGGSTIGLGKALALRSGLPQIVIPTTYAGSEATPILGQTEDGIKTTLSDARVLPRVILYDPELVVSLPRDLTVTSGLNAMAHAIEALYARDRTDESTKMALTGLACFVTALPNVIRDPSDLAAREHTLVGAWNCGAVLGRVGMALHHKLCHTLGGSFNLPHAQTHAIVLPHATGYNEAAVPNLLAPVADMLQGTSAGTALWDFAKSLDAPTALKDFGLTENDLDRAADLATQNPYWNPREIARPDLRQLLQNAWAGHAPGT
ncbi:MAG: maleylacetate reductase [Pseudomonadota bacterium]